MASRFMSVGIGFAAAAFGFALSAQAAPVFPDLVQIGQYPADPSKPTFAYTGGVFMAGPGAVGNGDGLLDPSAQTGGGLQVQTPFIFAPGDAPASAGARPDLASGSTSFYDVTLTLIGLHASGPAVAVGPTFIQPLSKDSFILTATDGTTVLLRGDIQFTSSISGNGGAADFKAATVTYTGGVIYDKFIAAGGIPQGDVSFALSPNEELAINPASGFLGDFTAFGNGHFNAQIPEPASLSLMALGSLALLARRRRA